MRADESPDWLVRLYEEQGATLHRLTVLLGAEEQSGRILRGALLHDDGSTGEGGILLVDTDDRAVAERFIADDPYTKAGLFEKVLVTRWRKAFFDGKALV